MLEFILHWGLVFVVISLVGLVIYAFQKITGTTNAGTRRQSPDAYVDERGRPRCGSCAKVVFNDHDHAERAVQRALSYGTYLRAYYERRCGNWHLTSQKPRGGRGRW